MGFYLSLSLREVSKISMAIHVLVEAIHTFAHFDLKMQIVDDPLQSVSRWISVSVKTLAD